MEREMEMHIDMNIEPQRRLHQLLDRALDLDGDARELYLQRACDDDPQLLEEAQRALAPGEVDLDDLFECPASLEMTWMQQVPESGLGLANGVTLPSDFGSYRIRRVLGEGGMGRVFLAEQVLPYRRKVALKVMRSSLMGERARARFDLERQALSRLDHVNIGHILDAGTTGDGVPFFAMELVEGEPLTDHCDARHLDLESRIELMIAICEGVEHAHGKHILHLDLKPSNLLVAEVSGVPVPKIIDFGVAKVLDHPVDGGAAVTRRTAVAQGHLLGTPSYMSPEALDGACRIDARADVFSLGVLLFELLVGVRPIESKGLHMAQLVHRICTQDAPSPVRRWGELTTRSRRYLARLRGVDPATWRRCLDGQVGRIVRRALQRDPDARYASAKALAEALREYLQDGIEKHPTAELRSRAVRNPAVETLVAEALRAVSFRLQGNRDLAPNADITDGRATGPRIRE